MLDDNAGFPLNSGSIFIYTYELDSSQI